MAPEAVAVLGVGMHEWGKWGRPFHEYGIDAALAALDDAGIGWGDVQLVAGGEAVRNGYPGYVAAATITQALGWNGARVATCYAACASGVTALDAVRARILPGPGEGALVVGADTPPSLRQSAPRPMALYGATHPDFGKVKVKNARHGLHNPYARYRKAV